MILTLLAWVSLTQAADPTWPKELTFALLSTESAPEVTRRWEPILARLEKDLGIKVKQVMASDYRGTIEALKFKKAKIGHLGPKAYVEATNDNYANVEPVVQVRLANGSLGYRSCLIVHADSDIFSPEDIGGKTFAFNDPNSTSGFLVPTSYIFAANNIDPKACFKTVRNANHQANAMAVANKQVAAATNNSEDLQRLEMTSPEARAKIKIIWTSPIIPLDPIVWRKDLDPSIKAKLYTFMLGYGRVGSPDEIKVAKDLNALPHIEDKKDPKDIDPLKKTHAEQFKHLQDDNEGVQPSNEGSLTGSRAGTAAEAKGDPYILALIDQIGTAWTVPTTLKDSDLQNLSADVCLTIADSGALTNYTFMRKSGNSQFDSSLDATLGLIKATKKLPPPPEKWHGAASRGRLCPSFSKQ